MPGMTKAIRDGGRADRPTMPRPPLFRGDGSGSSLGEPKPRRIFLPIPLREKSLKGMRRNPNRPRRERIGFAHGKKPERQKMIGKASWTGSGNFPARLGTPYRGNRRRAPRLGHAYKGPRQTAGTPQAGPATPPAESWIFLYIHRMPLGAPASTPFASRITRANESFGKGAAP